ncbi:AI-2E family transporter [Nesterenkonia sp.]|uniref:AI-2E family transporter n=1 Tax=Nesterenkonia sp. TaxID=704201 RepID=UPI00262E113D|nr:AI-2E family transporter [Nesterenkonia sp.]
MSTGQTPEDRPSQSSETTYAVAHPEAEPAAVGDQPPGQFASPRLAEEQRIQDDIPWGVRIAAAWSWRAIMILVAAGVAIWLLSHVLLILFALMVAGLLSTLLKPLHTAFRRLKFPRILAAVSAILLFLGVVVGLLMLVGQQIIQGFTEMTDQVMSGIYDLIDWADRTAQGFGLEVSPDQFNQAIEEFVGWIQQNQDTIMSSAVGFGSAATNITVGAVLVLFTLIFFLADGRRIWDFLVVFVPSKHRPAIHGAGRRGWTAVGTYMRVQVFVAFVDALGIFIGAVILNVPLPLPIAVLVFFGGFVPVVGAVVTGAVAVLLAWVAHDFFTALMMLGVVILVQQIESNVLQPVIMGKAVRLHPLAVVLAVTAGTTLMGIPGALFAVPVLAFINRATQYLVKEEWRGDDEALAMERAVKEEALMRAAHREKVEAEDRASLDTIKQRLFETIPGLDPERSRFLRRYQDDDGPKPSARPEAEAADTPGGEVHDGDDPASGPKTTKDPDS